MTDPPSNFSEIDFWRWVERETTWDIFDGSANPLANSYGMAASRNARLSGLPRNFDVDPDRREQPLSFQLDLALPARRLLTTNAVSVVRVNPSRYGQGGLLSDDRVRVRSTAQAYYARPQLRSDGRREWATTFRPFWQARLSGSTSGVARLRP